MRLEDFLSTNTQKQDFPEGAQVFTEGTQAAAAYYVLSGRVEIYKGPEGKETMIAALGPGQIFGEMALLRFDSYTLSARATEDTVLHIIPPEILQTQLHATHPLIRAILDMLVERVHDLNEVLIDLDRTS